jgi:hypothetical protein
LLEGLGNLNFLLRWDKGIMKIKKENDKINENHGNGRASKQPTILFLQR